MQKGFGSRDISGRAVSRNVRTSKARKVGRNEWGVNQAYMASMFPMRRKGVTYLESPMVDEEWVGTTLK